MDKICEILKIENKMCENCDKTHEIMKVRRQNVPLNLFFHLVPPHEKKIVFPLQHSHPLFHLSCPNIPSFSPPFLTHHSPLMS